MPGMLSQIEKRLEEKKSGAAKPWSAELPTRDEAPKPNRQPKSRGAPPPGFKNGTPTPPASPSAEPVAEAEPENFKVMGARVGTKLYAALEVFRKERGIKSLREALTIAAEERLGLR